MTDDLQPDERISIRDELLDAREERLREKSDDDDHFYGAWRRGGSVSGKAMAKAKARQRRRSRKGSDALAYLQQFDAEPFSRTQGGKTIEDLERHRDLAVGSSPGLDEAWDRAYNFDPFMTATWFPSERVERNYVKGILNKEGRIWQGEPNSVRVVSETLSAETEQMAAAYGRPRQHIAVYRGVSGDPVGYVHMVEPRSGYSSAGNKGWTIKGVHVFESEQGKGYGRKMYDAIQDETPINLYDIIGQSNAFTEQGQAFAEAWLRHRMEIERAQVAPGQTNMLHFMAKESAVDQMNPLEQARWALERVQRAPIAPDGMRSPEEN